MYWHSARRMAKRLQKMEQSVFHPGSSVGKVWLQ
jgi:hypothetical protein